jgi:hypothetical protein
MRKKARMPLVLYSRCCSEGFRIVDTEIALTAVKCPRCGIDNRLWLSEPIKTPRPLLFGTNDRRFLRALRIKADNPEVTPDAS